jgi:hypothetical protein
MSSDDAKPKAGYQSRLNHLYHRENQRRAGKLPTSAEEPRWPDRAREAWRVAALHCRTARVGLD